MKTPQTTTESQRAEQAGHAECVAVIDAMQRQQSQQGQAVELLHGVLCSIAEGPKQNQSAYAAGIAVALYPLVLLGLTHAQNPVTECKCKRSPL